MENGRRSWPTDPFDGAKVDGYRGDTNPYDLNDGEWSYVRITKIGMTVATWTLLKVQSFTDAVIIQYSAGIIPTKIVTESRR